MPRRTPTCAWTSTTGSSKLSSYDFKQKGFAIAGIFDEGPWRYFSDNGHYQFQLSNGTRYKFLPVADEGAARAVETLRSKHQPLTLRIYMFANAALSPMAVVSTVLYAVLRRHTSQSGSSNGVIVHGAGYGSNERY